MKTTCEEVKINLPEYIDHKLDEPTYRAISSHLESCDSCRALHAELSSFLNYMDSFPAPEPPEGMKEEFMELASAQRNREQRKTLVIPMWMKIAAMLILCFGTYWMGFRVGSSKSQMTQNQLASQLHEQKQQVMLASLRDYTGPQKIEAVYNISKSGKASDELINALVYTMNSDKNVNVRLAAINALSEMMGKNERVKKELIRSLSLQENSLLQISLIQVLTESGVKEAKDEIESMTNDEKTDESVKAFAKDMIKIIS
ncbi:MAG TPA: zf-HC2 domain-containing protein [Prolixibacteraceae bacterium]|jgi:hypothetical protein